MTAAAKQPRARVRWTKTTRVRRHALVAGMRVCVWCDWLELEAATRDEGGMPWGWRVASGYRIHGQGMVATEAEAMAEALALARRLGAEGTR